MTNKNILIIGGTGNLGKPVANEFLNQGFNIKLFVRDIRKAKVNFNHPNISYIEGDLKNLSSIKKALIGVHAVYLNLSLNYEEGKDGFHPEKQGLTNLLKLAKTFELDRIGYISSMFINNDSNWWGFKIKRDAVDSIKKSGIPHLIFTPSLFMETITSEFKSGNKLLTNGDMGKAHYWISVKDYAKQVVRAYKENIKDREFYIQGPYPMTLTQALDEFSQNYKSEQLTVSKNSLGILKFKKVVSNKANIEFNIFDAINKLDEEFLSDKTWSELGKPETDMENFAKNY